MYNINCFQSKLLLNKSPFEVLFATIPDYDMFRVLGCQVFPYLRDYSTHKLAPHSAPCIFLGYNSSYKGYLCLDPTTNHIYTTQHNMLNVASTIFLFLGKHHRRISHYSHILLLSCARIPLLHQIPL